MAPQLLLYSHVFPYSWESHVDDLSMSMTIFCFNPQVLYIYMYLFESRRHFDGYGSVEWNSYFPVSPQPTWAVSTTCWNITKDMVGRREFPLQTTEPTCKVYFFKKITINKRTEEQHTTSPIHIFIPDGWFCPDQATGFHPAAKVSCQDLEDEIHRPQKAGAISPSCCQTDFFINIAMLLIVWYWWYIYIYT